MARSWNFFFKSGLAGATLCGLTLLWTGLALAQSQNDQATTGTQPTPVQAVPYEGAGDEPPLFAEGDTTATATAAPVSTSLKTAMDELRKAYLMQHYDQALDLCQQIRHDFPDQAGQVDFYEKVSQRRLDALAKRTDKEKENPYPRISELLPELPTEQTQQATPGASQPAGATTATATTQAMPLPPSMAPTPPRPAPPSSLMTTLTTLPIWMYAVAGVVAIALILLILKLAMGGKGKAAARTTEAEADENAEETVSAGADDSSMFDPLGGLGAAGADDPFASLAGGGASDDPFGGMFDDVQPKAETPASQTRATPASEAPVETPAQDFSAFESLLDTKAREDKPQSAYHQVTGPIDFSFGDDEVEETRQAPPTPAESGVESIMDLFGDDKTADIPAQAPETPAATNDVEDILTFDGIEETTSTPTQEADTKMEDSVSDVFDEDFSISLDQPMAENTAMQATRSTQPPVKEPAPEEAGGEDLLLFDEASENTNIADLHIDETIDLEGGNKRPANGDSELTAEQTLISPLRPEDLDNDATASDLFDRERQAGEKAFNDNDWKSAVHHLTIAAALRPESAEVKALLREASRQNKTVDV